jgi:hypothetical protein
MTAPPRTRERVVEILTDVSRLLPINSSNDPAKKLGNPVFDKYTMACCDADWNDRHPDPLDKINNWQDRFNYDWIRRPLKGQKKENTTACNEFAGKVVLMASGPNLGGMNLRASLDIAGVPYAWVQAGGGAVPKAGDVLDFGQHIGMCFTLPEGGPFRHIDGGQGGPNTGYDIIKYGDGALSSLIGWADIDKVFGTAPADSSAPAWLAGWWTMPGRGHGTGIASVKVVSRSTRSSHRQIRNSFQASTRSTMAGRTR